MIKLFFTPSITKRVCIVLLAASFLVWGSIYVLGYFQVNRSQTGTFDRDLIVLANTVVAIADINKNATNIKTALVGIDIGLDKQNETYGEPKDFLMFAVWRADGTLVAKSRHASTERFGNQEQLGFFDAGSEDMRYRVYRLWSRDHAYQIEATQSMLARQQVFDQVMISREGLAQPIVIGFLVILLPVWFAVSAGLKPLRSLAQTLSARSANNLRPVVIPKMYAELKPMVAELNATMARLDELLQTERAFLADAAHELRTPLALVAAQSDALFHAVEPAEREEAARRLSGAIQRSSRLINQLLALARLDAKVEMQHRNIDLADIIRDSLASYDSLACSKNIELSYDGPESMPCHTLGDVIESIVDNLISNAIRYGRDGGNVLIQLSIESKVISICVADDGPGINKQSHALMFERFRRGKDVCSSGAGLGLAIVKSAVDQLGATILIQDGLSGQGISFCVRYPIFDRNQKTAT